MRTCGLLATMILLGGCGGATAHPGPPDMAPAEKPTLVAGDFHRYGGTTSDGWSIVVDGNATYWAIHLADGRKQKVADIADGISVYGDVAFIGHDAHGSTATESLSVWHGDGPAVTLSDSVPDNQFGFSPPASDLAGHIAYWRNGSDGKAELVLDSVAHTSPRVLLGGVELAPQASSCWPQLRFFGARLWVNHCGAGTTTRTLTSFDIASGAAVDVASGVTRGFSTRTGDGVLATKTDGTALWMAGDGSGKPFGISGNAAQLRFAVEAGISLLVTPGGELVRAELAHPFNSTILQASGVASLGDLSSDGRFLLFERTRDAATGLSDLWLADAHAASTATALDAAATSTPIAFFTEDSAYVFYIVDADSETSAGSLRARPSAGGPERILAAKSTLALPASGARVVFTANDTGTYPDARTDLAVVDLAGAGDAKTIATQAHAQFDILDDGHTLLYVQPGEGLHIVTLP